MKLPTSELIASNNTENTCVIDLRDYLPSKVIKEMSRKDGKKIKYVKFDSGIITKESVLCQRVGELVYWARDPNIGEDEVHAAMTVKFGGGGGADADGKSDGSESEEDPGYSDRANQRCKGPETFWRNNDRAISSERNFWGSCL